MARILVVDDVVNEAMQLAYELENLGHDVLGAAGGEEALEMAAAELPDVIFLDAVMPGIDGFEVCRRLKDDQRLSSIPVILTTDKSTDEDIAKGLDAGADDYLGKPYCRQMLDARLRWALRLLADRGAIAQLDGQVQKEIAERQKVEQDQTQLIANMFSASIQMLVDFLELLQPDCVGMTVRVHGTVKDICAQMQMDNPWEIDVATMLSHVGCVKVADGVLKKICDGQELSFSEKREFWKHPQIAADIIKRIPRMQRVARIVEFQERQFNGEGPPFDDRLTRETEIPLGARIIRLAIGFDSLVMMGSTNHEAMEIIRASEGKYDPEIVEVLGQRVLREPEYEISSLMSGQLRPGMILAEHILSRHDSVLIRNGRTINAALLRNLHRYRDAGNFDDRIREPIRVRVPVYREPEPEPTEEPQAEAEEQQDASDPQPQGASA